eukprot:2402218-Amphidinium_carterae.1
MTREELKPLTKARIRMAVQMCKLMWQPQPLVVAEGTAAPAGEALVKGKGNAPELSLQPMPSAVAAVQPLVPAGRKVKISAVLDQRSEAEVERQSSDTSPDGGADD